MKVSELDGLLRLLVRRFMLKNKRNIENASSTEDDLMQDARLAAHLAIERYDHTKNAKIETWIYRSVHSRLTDIARAASSRPKLVFDLEFEEQGFTSENEMNFDLSMRSILTEKEYSYYHLEFVEGYSIREVVRLKKFTKREIECLRHRILLKFASSEKNLDQHLTRKRLQESWLNNFQY